MRQDGILIGSGSPLRLVTHLDVSTSNVGKVVAAFDDYFARPRDQAV